jgi:hypothetical protein
MFYLTHKSRFTARKARKARKGIEGIGLEDRRQEAAGRTRRSEVRGQKTDDGRQRVEDRGKNFEFRIAD